VLSVSARAYDQILLLTYRGTARTGCWVQVQCDAAAIPAMLVACMTVAPLECSSAPSSRAIGMMVPGSLNPKPPEHTGSYGKVFKALRGEVQDVAVKQLLHAGDGQLESFMEVTRGSLQLHAVHNLECWWQDISRPFELCALAVMHIHAAEPCGRPVQIFPCSR
jgi:hypothetical protein